MKVFSEGDFDKLRSTLAAHLSDVIPERDSRNLIHDVKWQAAISANAMLAPLMAALEAMNASDGNGRDCEHVLAEYRKLTGEAR